MNENTIIKRQKLKYTLLFFLIFVLIFSLFGMIISRGMYKAYYEEVDKTLMISAQNTLTDAAGFSSLYTWSQSVSSVNSGNYAPELGVLVLIRDEKGSLLNQVSFKGYSYVGQLAFDLSKLNQPISQHAFYYGKTILFRTFLVEGADRLGNKFYLQLVIGTSSVLNSLDVSRDAIYIGILILLIVSVVVSRILGNLLVRPIIQTRIKQKEFISFASHELRAPLSVIHNNLELLLMDPNAKIYDRIELILKSLSETARLRNQTKRLLSITSLQSPELTLLKEQFSLDDLIRFVSEPYITQAEVMSKIFSLNLNLKQMLFADKHLINELLVILFDNALKYTRENDSITVSTCFKEKKAILKVADTGLGISDEAKEKIFTKFFRVESLKSSSEGAGLGLYIAQLIVKKHGGQIHAEDNSPKGAVFTVSLPLHIPSK